MGRFLIFGGILFIIAATIFMMAVLGVFGEDIAEQIIVPVACESGDTIRTQSRMTFSSTTNSQTTDFFCVDSEGIEKDITGMVAGIIIIGFGGLLVIGILATIIGSMITVRRTRERLMNQFFDGNNLSGSVQSSVINLRDGTYNHSQIPPEARATIRDVFSQFDQGFSNHDSLADKLRQLDEARQQGLISRQEYDRVRQAILDGMDD